MADLTFADSHNMVAYLEKSEDNADFTEIVNFLNASPIRYELTVSPTVYVSYIEQFWSTVKIKTVNNETQIRAKVDGKTIVITKSSVRRDLHFNDEDGITCLTNTEIFENLQLIGSKSTAWNEFGTNIASAVICLAKKQKFNFSKLIFDGMLRNLDPNSKKFLMYPRFLQLFLNNQIENLTTVFNDEYDTPSHTKKVFANMRRQGKDFSGTVTPLFATMLIQSQAVEGEGSGQPTEPQHTPTTASPSHVEPIPIVASSSQPKKTQKHRKTKRKATEISQSSRPTTLVVDETVHEERGDSGSPRRQDTMGDRPAQTRFERLSKQSNKLPLTRVNTLRSGEDSMKLQELIDLYTKLSDRVLDLENVKNAQALEIQKKSLGDPEDASKQERNEIDQDEGISWFQEDSKTQGKAEEQGEISIEESNYSSKLFSTPSYHSQALQQFIIVSNIDNFCTSNHKVSVLFTEHPRGVLTPVRGESLKILNGFDVSLPVSHSLWSSQSFGHQKGVCPWLTENHFNSQYMKHW
ncbi:hypothetical protein Tco_1170895 [Tanacetum coccineum]